MSCACFHLYLSQDRDSILDLQVIHAPVRSLPGNAAIHLEMWPFWPVAGHVTLTPDMFVWGIWNKEVVMKIQTYYIKSKTILAGETQVRSEMLIASGVTASLYSMSRSRLFKVRIHFKGRSVCDHRPLVCYLFMWANHKQRRIFVYVCQTAEV